MLWFERRVVGALMSPSLDGPAQTAVESYVDDTLRSMPEILRMGVAAESLLFGTWSRVEHAIGRLDEDRLRARVARWKESPLDPIRQYVRLLNSLVVFAEHELAPAELS
jgi:hypothetical protein